MRQNLRLKFDPRFVVKTFHFKFDTMCWKSANEIKQPNKAWTSKYNHDNILTADNVAAAKKLLGLFLNLQVFL